MLVSILIFLAVTVGVICLYLVAADLFFRPRSRLANWMDEDGRQQKRAEVVELLAPAGPDPARPGPLQRLILQAGVELTPLEVIAIAAGLAALFAAVAGLTLGVFAALLAALAGAAMPLGWLVQRKRSRQEQLLRQLPNAFDLMARVIRAGNTMPAALNAVSLEFKPPIGSAARLCHERLRLGLHPDDVFRELSQRAQVAEVKIFALGIRIQQQAGGNLADMLDRLAGLIRERVRFRGEVRALTAEGRMQARVLTFLPLLVFALMMLIAPQYARCLLDYPFLLVATGVSILLGTLWIQYIIDIDI
jgi:tight adherence protein B